jgi:hypothetical protein
MNSLKTIDGSKYPSCMDVCIRDKSDEHTKFFGQ